MKKIINLLKEYSLIIVIILLILINFIKFPYYIIGVGGLTNIDSKVKIENEYKSKGSINMTYVSEYRPNLVAIIYALISPNIDIYKLEDILLDDTLEDMNYRERLDYEEAEDNAIINAYRITSLEYEITNEDIIVTYVYNFDTDLKVKDKIIKIGDIDINSMEDIYKASTIYKDLVTIKVEADGKIVDRYLKPMEVEDRFILGILVSSKKKIKCNPNIELKEDSREFGSSGGLMLTLEIINKLKENDITHGYKVAGTGSILLDGTVMPIGGIRYKILTAYKKDVDIFFVPIDNVSEVLELPLLNNKTKIVPVRNISDALEYLENLS